MKKADLAVGAEYAVVPHAMAERASRVRLLRLGTGTEAEVTILTAVPMFLDADWKQGAVVTMSTRRITCAWTEWESGAEARDRRREERHAQAVERERLGDPDPDRDVPVVYEDLPLYREPYVTELMDAMDRGGGRYGYEPVVDGALDLLPLGVQRDVVAAARVDALGRESLVEGSLRAADVLAPAVFVAARPRIAVRPGVALADHDADFFQACRVAVAASGGVLESPFVPRIRVPTEHNRSIVVQRPVLGWVRVAFGWTSGRKLHEPDCHVLKSNRTSLDDAETMAMWRLYAYELCGACGGPGIIPSSVWVAFRAASDTWHVSRPAEPEPWQLKALLHLLADAARGRAAVEEPDRTREAVLLDAIADGMPGQDGWAAYRLAARFMPADDRPTGLERDPAAKLAYLRLRQLSDALPPLERPTVPFPLDNADEEGNVPGPIDAVDAALRKWFAELDAVADLPELHLSLFGLPGAVHAW